MTPEEAREALKKYTPREFTPGTGHYQQNAGYRALEAVAAEKFEYGVTAEFSGGRRLVMATYSHGTTFDARGQWYPTKEMAEEFMASVTVTDPRLVCRRVSTYWESSND